MRYTPGFRTYLPGQTQWQPTTTVHDPNPPITLEDGTIPDVEAVIAGTTPMGVPEFDAAHGVAGTIGGATPMGTAAFDLTHTQPAGTTGSAMIGYYVPRRVRDPEKRRKEHRDRLPEILRAVHMAGGTMRAIAPMPSLEIYIEHDAFSDEEIDELIDVLEAADADAT